MTPRETADLIERAGGNKAFAVLLGIDNTPWHHQRVCNWKARGLPARVQLKYLPKIQALQRKKAP